MSLSFLIITIKKINLFIIVAIAVGFCLSYIDKDKKGKTNKTLNRKFRHFYPGYKHILKIEYLITISLLNVAGINTTVWKYHVNGYKSVVPMVKNLKDTLSLKLGDSIHPRLMFK